MDRRILLVALAIITFIVGEPAFAARLIVSITGVKNASGGVYIGLYATPSKFLNGTQVDLMKKVQATAGPITVVFDNLPPGVYALGAYHDENNNDHFDTNFIGLPEEGYALSNGVRAVTSKPSFQQASFTIGTTDTPISLHIRY